MPTPKQKAKQTAQRKEIQRLKVEYLKYYSELPIQKLAAESIGRDEQTIIRWRKQDENFDNQTKNAKSAWAMKNSKGVKSKEWLLERVMKDHFSPKTNLDITSGGKPLDQIINEARAKR